MDISIYRPLGRTGLKCHPLGFGGYRIADGNAVHEAALRAYLDRGGNLIDTSANYTDGLSEQLIGRVIKDYTRDRLILVTKGGYIQGGNMELAKARNFPEVVPYGDDLWHCIHPEFLETQIRLSAERLQVETIDVYLLHNPEYYLNHIAHQGGVSAEDRSEFDRRIREAFRYLEEEVRRGRIRWYGISSNQFPHPISDPAMVAVEACLAAAREAAEDHHFAVVQLPLNLYESGGALEANNGGRSALEFGQAKGLGVLANRPLNAVAGGGLVRLADFGKPGTPPPGPQALESLLAPLQSHERAFSDRFTGSHDAEVGMAEMLRQMVPQLQSAAHLEQVAGPHIVEPIRRWLTEAQAEFGRRPEWAGWQAEFVRLINGLFEELGRFLASRRQDHSDEVRRRLIEAGYPAGAAADQTLSRMAIHVLLSLSGLSCALVGMRRPEYVKDLMDLDAGPALSGIEILKGFRKNRVFEA